MKKNVIVALLFVFSAATFGQTISTVSWINSNFDKDEGIVTRGVVTGPLMEKPEPPEGYVFTDDGGINEIQANFDDEGGGGGKLLEVPEYNEIITLGAIMDYGEGGGKGKVLEVKYWHYGENSIIDELGVTTIDQINVDPTDGMPFVLAGQFTGESGSGSKFTFADNTGELDIRLLEMDDPPFNVDVYVFGVIDDWWPTYEVYYYGEGTYVGIGEDNLSQIGIYPNPANNKVSIKASTEIDKIQLTNISGQIIFEQNTRGNNTVLNTSEFEPGIYFVKVFSQNNVITRKLVIE